MNFITWEFNFYAFETRKVVGETIKNLLQVIFKPILVAFLKVVSGAQVVVVAVVVVVAGIVVVIVVVVVAIDIIMDVGPKKEWWSFSNYHDIRGRKNPKLILVIEETQMSDCSWLIVPKLSASLIWVDTRKQKIAWTSDAKNW